MRYVRIERYVYGKLNSLNGCDILTLSSLSFRSGRFHLWNWSVPLFERGVSIKNQNRMANDVDPDELAQLRLAWYISVESWETYVLDAKRKCLDQTVHLFSLFRAFPIRIFKSSTTRKLTTLCTQIAYAQIKLRRCAVWSRHLLFAYAKFYLFTCRAHFNHRGGLFDTVYQTSNISRQQISANKPCPTLANSHRVF